jgi:hypothetical protein
MSQGSEMAWQNMFSNTTKQPTPSQPHTVCIYCTLTLGRGGGVGDLNQREGEKDNSSQSCAENTNMTDCISSL